MPKKGNFATFEKHNFKVLGWSKCARDKWSFSLVRETGGGGGALFKQLVDETSETIMFQTIKKFFMLHHYALD